MPGFERVVDANLNRAREGLRVCEEVARFILEDPRLTRRCQTLRYRLSSVSKLFSSKRLLLCRSVSDDPGRPALRPKRSAHRDYGDLVVANARRIQESLRVLEEFARLGSIRLSHDLGSLRFHVYTVEKDLLRKLSALRHH